MIARQAYLSKNLSDGLPSCEAIASFAMPLLKEISWLSKEISASHVIRSIICLLAGIPVVAEKKAYSLTSLVTCSF